MLTQYLIHLHLPRTGGSTLRAFLGDIPGSHIVSGVAHAPYDFFVRQCEIVCYPVPPAFIFIRNPWDWYVSQWSWVASMGVRGYKGVPFRDWMEVVEGGMEQEAFDFSPVSYAWEHVQGDKADYVGRFEDFEDEVVRILLSLSIVPKLIDEDWIRGKLKAVGRRRQERTPDGNFHGPYREYYDDEMRSWVTEWDDELIERFGYEF